MGVSTRFLWQQSILKIHSTGISNSNVLGNILNRCGTANFSRGSLLINFRYVFSYGVAQWLRRCATSRTVPVSIPGGVTGFFSDIFPSDQTMALGSTQSLVKMSTRNILGGKGGRCVRLTTYHHTVPLSRNLGALTSQTPLGLHGLVRECFYIDCTVNVRHGFEGLQHCRLPNKG